MSRPSDPIGAEQTFTYGPKLLHCLLASPVAPVDAELNPAHAALERLSKHHILDAAVETSAAKLGPIVSTANLQDLPLGINTQIARHAREFVPIKHDEGAVVGI